MAPLPPGPIEKFPKLLVILAIVSQSSFLASSQDGEACKREIDGVHCVLDVQVAQVRVPFRNISFYARTYNGAFPGPTIRIAPGDRVRVTLRNSLGPNKPGSNCSSHTLGHFRALNSTNLHIHGIYASPVEDNTFACVEPGKELEYEYAIRPDVGSSSLWYHPHVEGSGSIQLYGGMAGAFNIVDEAQDRLFGLSFGAEKTLLLQMLEFNPEAGLNEIQTFMSQEGASTLPLRLSNPSNFTGALLLSNGEISPTVSVKAGQRARLNLINAMSALRNVLHLGFFGDAANDCELHLLALDGVYR